MRAESRAFTNAGGLQTPCARQEAEAKYRRDWAEFSGESARRYDQRTVVGISSTFLAFWLVPFTLDINHVELHPLLRLAVILTVLVVIYRAIRVAQGSRQQRRKIARLQKEIEAAHEARRAERERRNQAQNNGRGWR